MEKLLRLTAWKINGIRPYGLFHFAFFIIGIIVCVFLANKLKNISDKKNDKLLFFIGLFLLVIEVYKELFYYFIVNNGHYDFSLFPFQLCDIPMYFCLIIPFIKKESIKQNMYNFLVSYNLLGAFITFFEPSALIRPYLAMTIHGFLWHIILVFIGLYLALSKRCLKKKEDFIASSKIYVLLCSLALILNFALKDVSMGKINLFYLGPSISPIIIFSDISSKFGWFTNMIVFVLVMSFASYLVYMFFYNIDKVKLYAKEKLLKEHS